MSAGQDGLKYIAGKEVPRPWISMALCLPLVVSAPACRRDAKAPPAPAPKQSVRATLAEVKGAVSVKRAAGVPTVRDWLAGRSRVASTAPRSTVTSACGRPGAGRVSAMPRSVSSETTTTVPEGKRSSAEPPRSVRSLSSS